MTGAMYAAVSGLKSHMSALNVIGNNIANVNTNGYKASRFTFLESLYTTVSGGADGSGESGGRNPAQLGYGCSVGTIDLDMSTKNYSPTGMATDVMIDGDGFFITGDKSTVVDSEETLKGMNLTRLGNLGFDSQGYLVDGQGNVIFGFLQVAGEGEPAEGEEAVANISSTLTAIRLPMASDGTGDAATGSAVYPTAGDAGAITDATEGVSGRVVLDSIGIDESTGRISGVTTDNENVVIGYIALAKVDNPNGVTHISGSYYRAGDGAGDMHLASIGGAVTSAEGDALHIYSSGATSLISGGLESSGTDLATEITNMITVQRGYQANTRIVTVTDSMLEELVNMKR